MPEELEILENTTADSPANSEPTATAPAEPVPQPGAAEASVEGIPDAENTANKTYKNAGVVDLVFLVDVTGSMG
ncbi:MAG: hypothetical protein J6866_03920, partial [Victivallales bacterium]|nr:hypothetical protein [Victivallales bacterium]